MNDIFTGQRVASAQGPGEVLTIFSDKAIIKLDNGETTTLPTDQIEGENNNPVGVTDLSRETQSQVEARAKHASQIVERLDHVNDNQNHNQPLTKQKRMEISENAMDVINDLIEINNDRVEGFEKASRDLEDQDTSMDIIFNKLANESRKNAAELIEIAQSSGQAPVEGTSISGAIHRAWLSVKSVFTGGDLESILDECERGEDAIKAAYRSALDPENEIGYELQQVLQKQQMGIIEGHDLIKSLRDQVKAEDEDYDDSYTADVPVYQEEAENSSYGKSAVAYQSVVDTSEQEGVYKEELETPTSTSKLMDFFVEELKDLLWAERKLVDTLPDMAEAATSQELKTAFTNHLAETEEHVNRLEQIFGILGLEPDTTKCDAMAGIVDEGDNIISNTEEGTAQRDVGLIFAGQKAEHYEIASYGGMISLAKTLGYYNIAEILVMTIDEEKTADALLTEIAENHVNYEASNEPAED